MSSVPRKIGPYELEGRLGAGGMGEVFRAHDQRLGRHVALKHVRPADAGSPARRARLRREAWSAAQLSHPAIVQIYDILEDPEGTGDGDWIVMEYVPGRTLAEVMADDGRLPLSQAVLLARQVAEGLAAAHARGVVHRDLKTENVMFAEGQAKILDFGLAKPERHLGPGSHTGTGVIVGTARAMSPEQARGRRVDFRSDLFSLGTLIYEMVAGRSPFLGSTADASGVASILTRVCSHQPEALNEVRDDVPAKLSVLVEQLLQKMPEARPESATAVAERLGAIEQVLGSVDEESSVRPKAVSPVAEMETLFESEMPPPAAQSSLSQILREHPRTTAAGALVAALGVALLFILAYRPDFASTEKGPGRDQPVQIPQSQTQPESAYDALRKGDELLARHDRVGHVDQALAAYDRALEQNPKYASAVAGKARARWRVFLYTREEAELDSAVTLARRAVALDPHLLRARISLALSLGEKGEYAEAESTLRRVLRLHPSSGEAHWALGRLHKLQGQLDAAQSSFRRAMELAPETAEYPFEAAILEKDLGRFDAAEELLQQSLRLAPDNAFAFYSLGVMSYFRGDYSEATRRFQQSIEIRPSAAAYSNLGTLYFFLGFYGEAVTAMESAVQYDGGNHLLWANLGDAYRWAEGSGDSASSAYDRALELLRVSLASHPDSPELRSRLALTLAKRGHREASVKELRALAERAAEWDDNASLLYRRALAWHINGERDAALGALAKAIAAGYSVVEIESDPELESLRADPRYEDLRVKAQQIALD